MTNVNSLPASTVPNLDSSQDSQSIAAALQTLFQLTIANSHLIG